MLKAEVKMNAILNDISETFLSFSGCRGLACPSPQACVCASQNVCAWITGISPTCLAPLHNPSDPLVTLCVSLGERLRNDEPEKQIFKI